MVAAWWVGYRRGGSGGGRRRSPSFAHLGDDPPDEREHGNTAVLELGRAEPGNAVVVGIDRKPPRVKVADRVLDARHGPGVRGVRVGEVGHGVGGSVVRGALVRPSRGWRSCPMNGGARSPGARLVLGRASAVAMAAAAAAVARANRATHFRSRSKVASAFCVTPRVCSVGMVGGGRSARVGRPLRSYPRRKHAKRDGWETGRAGRGWVGRGWVG